MLVIYENAKFIVINTSKRCMGIYCMADACFLKYAQYQPSVKHGNGYENG